MFLITKYKVYGQRVSNFGHKILLNFHRVIANPYSLEPLVDLIAQLVRVLHYHNEMVMGLHSVVKLYIHKVIKVNQLIMVIGASRVQFGL